VAVSVPLEGQEAGAVSGKTEVRGTYPVDPMVERIVLPRLLQSHARDQVSRDLLEEATSRVKALSGKTLRIQEPWVLRELSHPSAFKGELTLVHHGKRGVTAVLKGSRSRSLGIAVDVGTTTLAAYLCDLRTGTVLSAAGSANPQRRYGEDVISRIAFANENESGAELLHRLVVEEINGLMGRCLAEVAAGREDLDEVTVVGNTTMEELFVGLHPHSLGFAPYLPVSRAMGDFRAADMGLALNPGTNVHVFPVITGFVGGDTMGAILAERPHERDETSLVVDIGTNGELVLGSRQAIWVTSCATGPALEGAHISCGTRAVPGAIHRVTIDPDTYRPYCHVLGEPGGGRPRGVCGSGIIDAVAAMGRVGLLLESGRMREGLPGVILDEQGIGREYTLVPAEETAIGRPISITLSDIRQIQLAKAALSVGIKFLMRRAGVTRIHRMVLTGAFGARFDWRNAVAIGMLPEASLFERVEVVENAAGVGAIMALLDKKRREETRRLLDVIQAIELAEEPDFGMEFPMAMTFPQTLP
jgi:uncharacterized 2Fe-2S/4Fe-4S cluster protein (DUF4445 family)